MKKKLLPEYDHPLTHCILCGGEEIRYLVTDFRGVDIWECVCGMRFMNPQYSDFYLVNYYTTYYNERELASDIEEAIIEGHDFYLSLIEKFGANIGSLLDVGAGQGYLMLAAASRGWKATGYEIDHSLANVVSQKIGLPIFSGEFPTLQFAEKFNLVAMHQVLEHLKDPKIYLLRVREILCDGGYIFVAVPNIKSLSCRVKSLFERMGVRRSDVGKYYDSDHHVGYYSPGVLKKTLKECGFEIVLVRNGHSVSPDNSRVKAFVNTYILEHLYSKSTFFVVARKCS